MKEIKTTCYKGTRILLGNEKRELINKMIDYLTQRNFVEIQIPIIQLRETFENKVGEENNNMMYNLTDRGNRDLTLAPEYTAVVQKLANQDFKYQKDVKLFYVQQCFRGERNQKKRYREFTQFGVEILNPTKNYTDELSLIALDLIGFSELKDFTLNKGVTRGLDYYEENSGFEIRCEELGSAAQICGGGSYEGGIGFAIGVCRILNVE